MPTLGCAHIGTSAHSAGWGSMRKAPTQRRQAARCLRPPLTCSVPCSAPPIEATLSEDRKLLFLATCPGLIHTAALARKAAACGGEQTPKAGLATSRATLATSRGLLARSASRGNASCRVSPVTLARDGWKVRQQGAADTATSEAVCWGVHAVAKCDVSKAALIPR